MASLPSRPTVALSTNNETTPRVATKFQLGPGPSLTQSQAAPIAAPTKPTEDGPTIRVTLSGLELDLYLLGWRVLWVRTYQGVAFLPGMNRWLDCGESSKYSPYALGMVSFGHSELRSEFIGRVFSAKGARAITKSCDPLLWERLAPVVPGQTLTIQMPLILTFICGARGLLHPHGKRSRAEIENMPDELAEAPPAKAARTDVAEAVALGREGDAEEERETRDGMVQETL